MSEISKSHPYHILDLSPWPILTSFSLFFVALSAVLFMREVNFGSIFFYISIGSLVFCLYSWWRDVIKEGFIEKQHTSAVRNGLKVGMILFIGTEVVFFGTFFWSFFKSVIYPVGILEDSWVVSEGTWPPKNIEAIDAWGLPFLNTLILLLSGTCVTWSHYALKENNRGDFISGLRYASALGFIFFVLQCFEYAHAPFGIKDGIYAANFYMTTGFHGAHVVIGAIFLLICSIRAQKGHFFDGDKEGHLGFEFASWYWHFVDAVWLFLFVFMYVFGG